MSDQILNFDGPDAPVTGALKGLKVIDLTRVLGGPYCTMILGDHGADIIKIEPPQGDETRDWGPPFLNDDPAGNMAAYYMGVNRNKRSLGLDLGKPEGKALLLRLLEGADVLIENFKPGQMEKWGLGYQDVLSQRFPGLVHCRVTGYGATGPMGGDPGYDAVVQAVSGMSSINGTPTSGPTRLGTPIVDMGTGLNAAIAILMALYERNNSGRGQYLDMTLYDCAVALLHPQANNFLMNGAAPKTTGNAHPNIYPYDSFKTADKDLFTAVGNDGQFRRLCGVIGQPELADDPRFATAPQRSVNREALKPALEGAFATWHCDDLARALLDAGVPAGPVNDVPTAMTSEHTLHRRMRVSDGQGYNALGIQAKLSRTPGNVRRAPPQFGQDGRDILAEAGLSPDEVAALIAAGVVVEQRRR
ncbi:MAG: CoA transferase [Alphaproteobacteria bacterium]|nr:CoA transferase [Alphaproteobacteria bacterium]MCB9927839.1 CoA transferase [Alphaproteobacteria bacterium]